MNLADKNDVNFYTEKQLKNIADDIEVAITIPVNKEIDAEHRVFDFSEVKEILSKASRLSIQDCGCRSDYGNCDSPLNVCLSLDKEADYALEKGLHNVHEVTLEEAVEILKKSHEAGLVHMAYVFKDEPSPGLICSCCNCCCHTLGGLLRYGISAHVLTSNLLAEDVKALCTDCGRCVDRCVFRARSIVDGVLVYDSSKCFGCGLCVTSCPSEAISLSRREK